MADLARLSYFGGIACIFLALVSLLAFALWPALLGENELASWVLPIISMLLIVLAGLLVLAGSLLYVYEIATAKNDNTWKCIWIVAILVFGLLGAAAYELVARKERKA